MAEASGGAREGRADSGTRGGVWAVHGTRVRRPSACASVWSRGGGGLTEVAHHVERIAEGVLLFARPEATGRVLVEGAVAAGTRGESPTGGSVEARCVPLVREVRYGVRRAASNVRHMRRAESGERRAVCGEWRAYSKKMATR